MNDGQHVVLIATGGTIATRVGADGVARPALGGDQLIGAAGIKVRTVDLMAVDSSELTPADWQQIAGAVSAAVDGGARGVVITHGTDTMEETSLWLDLTYRGEVPVVLTGSMRPADDPKADGPANVRDAVALAASDRARDLGVLVTMGSLVWQPLGLTKTARGLTGRRIGMVHDGSFVQDRPAGRITLAPGGLTGAPPRVDIVGAYPGADAVAMDACVAAGARGIVLETVGSGNAGSAVVQGVSRLVDQGVPVALTTRVPESAVGAHYGPGAALLAAGAMPAGDLRASQARVYLMAALASGGSVSEAFELLQFSVGSTER